jgi:hypothetical protein
MAKIGRMTARKPVLPDLLENPASGRPFWAMGCLWIGHETVSIKGMFVYGKCPFY